MCVCAVNGLARAEAGAVHILEVSAATSWPGHQYPAVCFGRGGTLANLGPIHSFCQPGCAAHGAALSCLLPFAVLLLIELQAEVWTYFLACFLLLFYC